MSDSKHRIFSSSENPENPQKNVHDHVDKISFNQGNIKTEIELHPGYNAIIGSRGAGKSTLVEVIKKNDLSKRNINDIKYYFQSNPTNLNDNQIAYFEQGSFTDFFSSSENAKLSSINYLKELEVKLSEELKEENSKILLEINNLKEKILSVCGEYFYINDNDKFMILENSKITLSEESALEL
jgi:ABC-type Mn2+/Zn2+ transport system ATPase subunit